MSDKRITIAYEGIVHLAEFESLVTNFKSLVNNLSREVANASNIEWEIAELNAGSAFLTVEGHHPDADKVPTVVNAWASMGASLQRGEAIPYSDTIKESVDGLLQPLNGKVSAARWGTVNAEYKITRSQVVRQLPSAGTVYTLGIVKGRVQTITTRNKLQFTLFDHLSNNAVYCQLDPQMKEEIRKYWDEEVLVSGQVERNLRTGLAKSIRQVTAIERAPKVDPEAYKKTRGLLAWMGDEPAEKLIRRVRDE